MSDSSATTTATESERTQVDANQGEAAPARKAKLGGGLGIGQMIGLVFALVALIAVGTITAGDRFLSVPNFLVILEQAAVIGVISIGVTFVITSGGIDLSVGSVMGLATIWATTWATQNMAGEFHWIVMVLTALAVGGAAGLINGLLVAYGRVVSFIATLAMLVAARGLAEIISGRQTQVITDRGFLDFFRGDILGIPMIVWMFAVIAVIGWFIFNRTTFGRRTIAVGGNPEAARLAGINVKRHTMWVFTLAGLCVGIAATMILARTTAGSSSTGSLYELDAIAAVVIGGTLLVGGRGTIVGTVLGVLVFQILTNVFTQNNLDSSVQAVAKGAIIVIAVLLQQRFATVKRR